MTNINDLYGSEWLRAVDLKGHEHTVVIDRFETNQREKEDRQGKKYTVRRIALYFRGAKKKLELNNINAAAIAFLHGDEIEDWVGKEVTIFPTKTQFGNELVDCIRIRPPNANKQIASPARTSPIGMISPTAPAKTKTEFTERANYTISTGSKPRAAPADEGMDDEIPF